MSNRQDWNEDQYMTNVRLFIRDNAAMNKLLDGRETDDVTLRLYMDLAIDDFNSDPPNTTFCVVDFPSKILLIYGTCIQLLLGNGILMSRNRLNYSDGGISVQVYDKAGEYAQWLQHIVQFYTDKKNKIKYQINILSGFGEGIGPGSSRRDLWSNFIG
jgi:hypothetical protein